MKRWLWIYAVVFACSSDVCRAQRINVGAAPVEDSATRLVLRFDQAQPGNDGARYIPGRFGQAIVPGKEGLKVPNDAKGQHPLDVNQGTLEFWIRTEHPESLKEDWTLAANDVGHGKKGNFRIWVWRWQNVNYLRFDLHMFAKLHDAYIIHPLPKDANWHHIAAVWDRTWGIRLYVDGNLIGERAGTWDAMATPTNPLVLGPGCSEFAFDELRISSVARLGQFERLISYSITPGNVSVENGKSVLPVCVKLTNGSPIAQKMTCRAEVVDYFQSRVGQDQTSGLLKPSESREMTLKVPVDEAGPYVKVIVNGAEGESIAAISFGDEQIFFTDTLVGARNQISLNGAWDMATGPIMGTAVPASVKWMPCKLPYRWVSWYGDHTRWFRKKIMLPEVMRGKRIELHLSGVRFHAEVVLNGTHVGGLDTDQMPCVFDLTSAAKVGAENELAIGVTDWVSCVAPELRSQVEPIHSHAWVQGREVPGMPFIRPCTMNLGAAGISDPIYLVARPTAAITDMFATTAVRKEKIQVRMRLKNDRAEVAATRVRFTLLDHETVLARNEGLSVKLRPGQETVEYAVPVDMKKVTLWWPWKPRLYRLRAELMEGDSIVDRYDVRIGFREFWADGPVFRINGVAIRPNAISPIPFDFPGLAHYDARSGVDTWMAAKRFLQSFQYVNANLCRFHSEPYPRLLNDIADEIGLMVVSEAWMATIPLKMKLEDDRTWKNFAEFYPKWVERDMNHPSVVIRSMENELGYLLPERGQPRGGSSLTEDQTDRAVREMRGFGRLVRRMDPSRLVMYEGSGPVFYDAADIYNLHYPGIPGGDVLYPITARRMSMPIPSYSVTKWVWDRKKPLYIGEYDSCFSDASSFARMVGDDAYVNNYLLPYHLTTWSYSIPGQRIDGVTCGVPWTVFEMGWEKSIRDLGPHDPRAKLFREMSYPVATFVHQYRETYFEKSTVARTLTTLNDTLERKSITVRWRLSGSDGAIIAKSEFTVALDPAESKVTQVSLTMPEAKTAKELTWTVATVLDGEEVHTTQRTFRVFPNIVTPPVAKSRVVCVGLTESVVKSLKLESVVVGKLSDALKQSDVVLISGKEAGRLTGASVEAFLNRGGRLAVLQVREWPKAFGFKLNFPAKEEPIRYRNDANPRETFTVEYPGAALTATFPRSVDHPVLQGLAAPMLKFWREDHLAVERSFVVPTDCTARVITDCGVPALSPLLEVPCGSGVVMAVQYPVLSSFDDQPAARVLLSNVVGYLDGYHGTPLKDAVGMVAGPESGIRSFLPTIGAKTFDLTGRLGKMKQLDTYGAIVVGADERSLAELRANQGKVKEYVKRGGTVWLHVLDAKAAATIKEMIPAEVTVEPLWVWTPIRVDPRGFFAGLSNNDLYWPEGSFLPPASPRVAKLSVRIKGGQSIGEPSVAAVVEDGQGWWLIDQVTWDTELSQRLRAQRYVRALLANLHVMIRKVATENRFTFDASRGFVPVDIRKACNEPLLSGIWGTNRGYRGLVPGLKVIGESQYDIIDPAKNGSKACVVFRSAGHNLDGLKEVTIPVGRSAACLRFLTTSMWTNDIPLGATILDIDVQYADGSTRKGELKYARDVLDWFSFDITVPQNHPRMVWMGKEWPNPALYDFVWTNPQPEKKITAVRLSAANDVGYAIVFAITVQEKLSETQKKKAEWIPGLGE